MNFLTTFSPCISQWLRVIQNSSQLIVKKTFDYWHYYSANSSQALFTRVLFSTENLTIAAASQTYCSQYSSSSIEECIHMVHHHSHCADLFKTRGRSSKPYSSVSWYKPPHHARSLYRPMVKGNIELLLSTHREEDFRLLALLQRKFISSLLHKMPYFEVSIFQ